MGDPIVISDDSDEGEWLPVYPPWQPPEIRELTPGPSYSQIAASSPLVSPLVSPLESPMTISLTSPLNSETSLNAVPQVVAPGIPRPMDLIDLTADPGMSTVTSDTTSLIDLTSGDDQMCLTNIVCAAPNTRFLDIAGQPSGALSLGEGTSTQFNICLMGEVGTLDERMPLLPEGQSCESITTETSYMSPVASQFTSLVSLDQSCSTPFNRDLGSLASFHHCSDVAAISSSSSTCSHMALMPMNCVLENFYQIAFENPEELLRNEPKSEPISAERVQIIINTIETNFPEATVQWLTEFVTEQFYPPREILSHVIRNILLSPDVGPLLNQTFRLLIKIQELHPASLACMEWDWDLLTTVLQKEVNELPGQALFLRYVIKTLEDDFQEGMKKPPNEMQNTIANVMLSCDREPHHIKDIINWLLTTLCGSTFPLFEVFSQRDAKAIQTSDLAGNTVISKNTNQVIVLYLQKMLGMAVEVDRTPNCTSNKIAEMLFAFVINIPERHQREAFFTSMENHLLRCKVLELIMLHSCEKPTTLPLSFAQILYFLNSANSLFNQTEDLKWARWDELVEHLQFLLISYQHVIHDHLRISVRERQDQNRIFRQQMHQGDDITALDIELQFDGFFSRMRHQVRENVPIYLQEKLFLLKLLFLRAIHGMPLLEGRFQEGGLMKPHALLDREYPNTE